MRQLSAYVDKQGRMLPLEVIGSPWPRQTVVAGLSPAERVIVAETLERHWPGLPGTLEERLSRVAHAYSAGALAAILRPN